MCYVTPIRGIPRTVSSSAKTTVAELIAHVQSRASEGTERFYDRDCALCIAKPFGQTERRRGPQAQVALNRSYQEAFPEFRIEVDSLLEEGNRVAVQWRLVGKPSRELIEPMTQVRVRPITDCVRVEGIAFHRLRGDRVHEMFLLQDDLGMLLQLGVDPGGLPVVNFHPGIPQPEYKNGIDSPSEHKRLIHEFMKRVVNEKDEARRESAAVELMDSDLQLIGPDAGNVDSSFTGLEKFTAGHRKYRTAFPEFEFVTQDLIEEGNKVALRWTVANAWHTGPLQFGEFELHPTGNCANVHGAAVCEIIDGKIATIWQLSDSASLLRQLLS